MEKMNYRETDEAAAEIGTEIPDELSDDEVMGASMKNIVNWCYQHMGLIEKGAAK